MLAVGGARSASGSRRPARSAPAGAGPIEITVERDGQQLTVAPDLVARERADLDDPTKQVTVGVLGVEPQFRKDRAGPIDGHLGVRRADRHVVKASGEAMANLPEKIPNLVESIGGASGTRRGWSASSARPASPVRCSASTTRPWATERLQWCCCSVAALNVFIGLFNALPLLPLDGGHMAVVDLRGRPGGGCTGSSASADPGRVDMNKLLPLAYGFLVSGIGLTRAAGRGADVVNPITIS